MQEGKDKGGEVGCLHDEKMKRPQNKKKMENK